MNEETKLKKEPCENGFDDALRTLASAAIERDSIPLKREPIESANCISSVGPEIKEPPWYDVGIIRGQSCVIKEFYNTEGTIDHNFTTSGNLPDYTGFNKLELLPGTAYKFRLAAINSHGCGAWSDVSAFKTCLPGFPGAPCSIRISKSADGARLQWEPPALCSGKIIEYSVCLAIKPGNSVNISLKDLPFMRVYSGVENTTFVDNISLNAAYVDTTTKPAIIFRIAAKNEKGYGPATQVRWLQEVSSSIKKNVTI